MPDTGRGVAVGVAIGPGTQQLDIRSPAALAAPPSHAVRRWGAGRWGVGRWPWVGIAALITVLLRVPFLTTPLNSDEGGYATIVTQWSHGARLYHEVWVDRPQGMLVLYRLVFATVGPHIWAIRLLAALWAAAGVVAVAVVARALGGRRAGVLAALVFAVLSATPRAEGFAANGELLAGVPAVLCVALFTIARRRCDGAPTARARGARTTARWYLLGAGAAAMMAVLMKQSGFDGGLAVVSWLAAAALTGRRARSQVLHEALWFGCGALVMLVPALVDGITLGLSDWWFAVIGERTIHESVLSGSPRGHLSLLLAMVGHLWPTLLAVALLLSVGAASRAGQGGPMPRLLAGGEGALDGGGVLLIAWVAAALAGFAIGGLFHPHYVIGLTPVASVVAGLCVHRALAVHPARAALAVVAALALYLGAALPALLPRDPTVRSLRSTADARVVTDARVGAYLQARTEPQDSIYAMYADAGLYFAAHRRPASPYLWWLNLEDVPGAVQQLADVFAGPDAPRFVAMYGSEDSLPGGAAIAETFRRRYRPDAVVDGVPIYRLVA